MKQVLSILLGVTFLSLNMGLRVTRHYCQGELKETAVVVMDENLGCEMQTEMIAGMSKSDCGMDNMRTCDKPIGDHDGFRNNCCDNETIQLKLDDNYEKQQMESLAVDYHFFAAYIISYINLFNSNTSSGKEYIAYSPPLLERDVQVLNQTFLL